MKKCTGCKEDKKISDFQMDRSKKDNLSCKCKTCLKSIRKKYYLDNKEATLNCCKKYREANRNNIREYSKKYWKDNRVRLKGYRNEYSRSHKGERAIYHVKNKEQLNDYCRRYSASLAGKEAQRRTIEKYPNANKSRAYYYTHREDKSLVSKCFKCSSIENIEAHHHDYNKPMDITGLCRSCHREWHTINTPINRVSGIFTEINI